MLAQQLHGAETGSLAHTSLERHVATHLRGSLRMSHTRWEAGPPQGGATLGRVPLLCCDLEPRLERLLLTGAADGTVTVCDTQPAASLTRPPPSRSGAAPPAGPAATLPASPPVQPLLRLPRAHRFACTSVAWYPDGGGLFFSASVDGTVCGFDVQSSSLGASGGAEAAIRLTVAAGLKVTCMGLSRSCSSPHGLLAAGTNSGKVVLLDPGAGGGTHTLVGHRDAALAVAWVPGAEWLLATAGADCALRLWDVRRSGTLLVFDSQRTAGAHASQAMLCDASGEEHSLAPDGGGGADHSGQQFATAHGRPIVAVTPSPDGRLLYTSATDGRLRAWCVRTGCHVGTHFACDDAAAATTGSHPLMGSRPWGSDPALMASSLAVTSDGECIYRPVLASGGGARAPAGGEQAFNTATGECTRRLEGGHAALVRGLAVHGVSGDVFTVSQDGRMLAWTTARAWAQGERVVQERGVAAGHGVAANVDAWSDDEEERHRGPRFFT